MMLLVVQYSTRTVRSTIGNLQGTVLVQSYRTSTVLVLAPSARDCTYRTVTVPGILVRYSYNDKMYVYTLVRSRRGPLLINAREGPRAVRYRADTYGLPACCLHSRRRGSFLPPACLPACLPPAFLHACLASFLPAFLPALLPACMLASLHGCLFDGCLHDVRDSFGIRSRFVRDACLPACLPAGRTVLYCTTCRYGSPHCRTGCIRNLFGMRSRFVRESFGMPACLPACLPTCNLPTAVQTFLGGSPHWTVGILVV